MSDLDLRAAHRAVALTPDDELARGRLLEMRSRHGEPVHRELVQALAATLLEIVLVCDPWAAILTPCCGVKPIWSPASILDDFRLHQTASCPRYFPPGHPNGTMMFAGNFGNLDTHDWQTAWLNRCAHRGRRFLSVSGLAGAAPNEIFVVSRTDGDRTPRFRGPITAELVRAILSGLPGYHAAGQIMVVRA